MSRAIIRSVKFNFIMNFILTASSFIFPLITFPYVARVLGPEGNGKVSFAISVISYFQMIAQLGIPTYGIRACAKVRDNKEKLSRTVQELLIINMVITAVTYAVLLLALFVVPKFGEYRTLLIINSIGLILNVFGMNWLYSALEQYSYITIRSLVFKAASLILMFLFVRQESDYIIYGAILVFASFGSNIINILNCRKFIYTKPLGNYKLRKHVKPVLTFFAMSAAINIYTNLDTIMLGFMKGDIEVGYYTTAVKVKIIIAVLVSSLGNVLLPRMSYFVKYNMKEEFDNMVTKSLNFVILLSFPLVIYCVLYSKEIVLLLAGNSFLPATVAMQVIIPAVIAMGLTNILGIQVLVPTNREKCTLISVIIGAVVDLALCYILIPLLGASGAALGTLIAEFAVLIVQVYYLKDFLNNIVKNINPRYVIISSSVASLITLFLKSYQVESLILTICISALVYFGSYSIALLAQKEPLIYSMLFTHFNRFPRRRLEE